MFKFNRRSVKVNQQQRRRNAALDITVERLESRLMLAANVSVIGSNVVITGTAANDTLTVFKNSVTNTVQVNDGIVTQDTGLSSIGNLTINSLGGDDTIRLTSDAALQPINITGSLVINTAAGNDVVSANNVNVNQNVTINTGTDTDTVSFGGQIAGNLTILTGPGNSLVDLTGQPDGTYNDGFGLVVGGNVSVTGGLDVDVVLGSRDANTADAVVIQTLVGGNLTVNSSSGNDVVVLGFNQATIVLGNVLTLAGAGDDIVAAGFPTGALIVQGNVTQDTSLGDDVSLAFNATVGGTTAMRDVAGTNTILVAGTNATGDVTVTGGSGVDTIVFVNSTFNGSLTARANAGDDLVIYDNASVVMASGLPRLTLDGGVGNDTLAPAGTAFTLDFFGATITNFEVT